MDQETKEHSFPMNALILDSAPGKVTFKRAAAALSHDLPRTRYLHLLSLYLMYLRACFL